MPRRDAMAVMEALVLPAVLDSLAELRAYARRAADEAGLSSQRRYALELAVDEIATNVITYGYGVPSPEKQVWISAEITAKALVLSLADEGTAYDPRDHRLPTEDELAAPLETRPVGGLGILLALRGVDGFDYRSDGRRNVNVFEMRLDHG